MALVDELYAGHFGAVVVVAEVDVDFGARAAGTRRAHLPKIVMLIAEKYSVGGQVFEPIRFSLVVGFEILLLVALKNRCVKAVFVEFDDFGKELPRPIDDFFLEIVAERPIAQHLKHRVVVGVVSYFFEVVVLARHAETLLRIRDALVFGGFVAKENVLELIHSGIGEHQRWVVLDHHRRRRHYFMLF